MSITVRQDFINFCNTRRHALIHIYPNATPKEIVVVMLKEFNELTPLPPPYVKCVSATTDIELKLESLTISGMLFNEKK